MENQERQWTEIHAEHYTAIHYLLESWSELWRHSIFERFTEMEQLIPEAWFHFGATAELSEQFAIARGGICARAPDSLLDLIQSLEKLCALPRAKESPAMNSLFAEGVSLKKKHEIEAVLSFFLQRPDTSISRILDIGGGAGHLARHLARGLGCPVDSIDRDSTIQKKGLRILERHPWRGNLKHPVRFVPADFLEVAVHQPRDNDDAWAVGLHTCGQMAWAHLELFQKRYSVLNFGCCYEKLDVATDTQRSRLARKKPLALTAEALFLANRNAPQRPLAEFIFQQRVQRYRFSLFELLSREGCGKAQSGAVGSASVSAYSGTFADYVRDRLQHLEGLPESLVRFSDAAFEDFFRSVEALVERKRFIAFARNMFARPIEVAILLDRALFIEQQPGVKQGQVQLIQFFDPTVSPRNIGLVISGLER